jgi:hypothetical protein
MTGCGKACPNFGLTSALRLCAGIAALLFGLATTSWSQTESEPAPAPSQEASAPRDAPKSAEAKPPPSILERLPRQEMWLPLKDGTLVLVEPGATLEGYYDYLQQLREKPAEKIAPEIAQLTLTGSADDRRALLQAKLVIRHRGGDEFVRVPVAMHEAVIRSEILAKGPGILQKTRSDPSQGHVWWLRGRGDYELNLEISVPVKKLGADRRLQLTLPTATQTRLNLTTGFPAVVVKESEGDVEVINGREPNDPPARIVKYGLGPRLDLTWQPVVDESPVPAVLEAETVILAHANQDRLFLEAFQRMNVVQGSLSEVVVRLPEGADLITLEGARDYRSHRRAPDDPSRVIVQLNGPKTGKFELNWTVGLKPSDLGRFVISGFQVEQARNQVGQIGLSPVEGLRLTVANADDPHLLQINTGQFRAPSSQVTRAYKFYSQPFRLIVAVETVEPYFTVQPRISLGVTSEELTLDAEFAVRVLRGNLSSVFLEWPNWKTDEWKTDGLLEETGPETPAAANRLRLRLPDGQGERATLRLKARRPIRAEASIPLSLPRIIASDSAPTELRVSDAPNVGSELTPIGETVLNLVNSERFLAEKPPKSAGSPPRLYRVLTGEQLFSLRVNRLKQRVELASTSDVSLRGSKLHVVQSLNFNVQHEPLHEVRIAVPDFWRHKPVEFFLEPDRNLPAAWFDSDAETPSAQIALPEPQLGAFTILAVTEIPVSDEALAGQAGIEIPILDCQEHPAASRELVADGENTGNLVLTEADWKPQPELSGGSRWTTEAPASSVTVQFQRDGGGAQNYLVTAADILGEWDPQGVARCRATYRLSGGFSRLQVALPADALAPVFEWDGRPLRSPGEVVSENKPWQYLLRIISSGNDGNDHELTVRYRMPSSRPFSVYDSWTLAAPQLAQGRWIAETTWRIRVPAQQHLFAYSAEVAPRFTWQRTGVFFSRVSAQESTAEANAAVGPRGNDYVFSQYGEARELRFATMSAPLVLFLGASASLLVGFLLLNFTRVQHVMTLWIGAVLVSAAGLWFRPQLELLLQPILVGCLLALAAVALQNLWKQKTPPVMTFDPLMDLVESRSSVSRPSFNPGSVGEPMLVRAPGGSTHDFLQTEARSSLP